MGKRSVLLHEVGGLPVWGMLLAVVSLGGLGAYALANVPDATPAVASAPSEPRPILTPPASDRTFALFVGDSYSAGTGASSSASRWTTLVAAARGWTETNLAQGGTGYVTSASTDGCGKDYCQTYIESIQASKAVPDVVVISGGRNDDTRLAGNADAVQETIAAARSKWPDAQVLVTRPIWDDDREPRWFGDAVNTVRSAAEGAGATWVDIGEPLLGRDDFVIDDSVHPNDAGHDSIAKAFLNATESLPTA